MLKFFTEVKELFHEIGELCDLFMSGNCEVINKPIREPLKMEIGKNKVIEPNSSMPEAQLRVAVELKALVIYENSKGTPTEQYELEALTKAQSEEESYKTKPQIKRIHAILDYVGTGKKVLDCAGGSGYIGSLLQQAGNYVVVLDHSEIQLLRAKWLRKLKTMLGEVYFLPYPDHSFDVIIMADILDRCETMSTALFEAERVCKRDGQIIVTVPIGAAPRNIGGSLRQIQCTKIDGGGDESFVLSIKNIKPKDVLSV